MIVIIPGLEQKCRRRKIGFLTTKAPFKGHIFVLLQKTGKNHSSSPKLPNIYSYSSILKTHCTKNHKRVDLSSRLKGICFQSVIKYGPKYGKLTFKPMVLTKVIQVAITTHLIHPAQNHSVRRLLPSLTCPSKVNI